MTTNQDIENLLRQVNEASAQADWVQAYELWEQACLLVPNKVEYLLGLSLSLQNLRRFDEVVDVCDQILALTPAHPTAMSRKANALEKSDKSVLAILEWRKIDRLSFSNVASFYRIARIFKKNNRLNGARLSILKALSLYRLDEDLVKLAVSVLCPKRDRLLLSELWLADGFSFSANRPVPRKLITSLIEHENFDEAAQMARRNWDLEPANRSHLSLLIKLHLAAEDEATYQKVLMRHLRRFPDDDPIRWKVIRSLEKQEHWSKAADFTGYFFLTDYQASKRFARQLQNAQKLEELYTALGEMSVKWPDISEVWLKYIRVHIKLYPDRCPQRIVDQALKSHPDHIPFQELAAKNHWKAQQWSLAHHIYDELYEKTGDIKYHKMAVRSLIHAGKTEQALKQIENASQMEISDGDIFTLYSWLYKYLKDFQKLSDLSEKWLARFPDSTQAWSTLFFAYLKTSRLNEALSLYRRAESSLQRTLDNILLLAEMAYKLKRTEDISTYCEIAISQGARFKVAVLVHKLGELGRAFDLVRQEVPSTIEEKIFKDELIKSFNLLGLRTDLSSEQLKEVLLPEAAIYALVDHAKNLTAKCKNKSVTLVSRSLGAGGAERQVVATLRGLCAQSGLDVNLIARHSSDNQKDQFYLPLVSTLPVKLVEPDPFVAFDHPDARINALLGLLPLSFRRQVLSHLDLFEKLHSHTVHIWQDTLNITAGLAALISKTPHIIVSARTQPEAAKLGQRYLRAAYKALLSNDTVSFCTNSKRGALAYSDWLDIPVEKTHVIYNGLEQGKLSADQNADDPVPPEALENSFVVGSVFRFVWQKDPELWIKTARHIHEEYPSCKFVIVGEGELKQKAEDLIESYGLRDCFILPGQVKNVSPWLEKMDVFLMTSSIEGLPNAALEAQAHGLCVVTTDAGGCAETIVEGLSGYRVLRAKDEEKTARKLAEKVCLCLGDPQWRDMAATCAKENISQKFSISKMVADTLDLYATHGGLFEDLENSKCVG